MSDLTPHQRDILIAISCSHCGRTFKKTTALGSHMRFMHHHDGSIKTAHPLYSTWYKMIYRCTNPKSNEYRRYGARGITVCERWLSFESFIADVGQRPENHTIDRVRNNEGYSPDNFRWATMKTQSRNTRRNLLITSNGMTKCMAEWLDGLGIDKTTFKDRIKRHGVDKAIAMGGRRKHRYDISPNGFIVGGKIEDIAK